MTTHEPPLNRNELKERVAALQLPGLLAHWNEIDEHQLVFWPHRSTGKRLNGVDVG